MRLFVPGSAWKVTPKAKQAAMARTKPPSWTTRLPKGPTPISKDWRRSL